MGRKSENVLSNSSFITCRGSVNDLSFELHMADIFSLGSEGLINPANNRLDHVGGLAANISSLAGKEFAKACGYHLRDKKLLSPGEILVTDSFELKKRGIKKIINVVGEVIDSYRASPKQERSLKDTIQNSILKAEENNLNSLSMPAVSCGIFRFPLDQAARCHVEGFISASEILKRRGNAGASMKVVRFAFIQELEATEFSNCFLESFEKFSFFAYHGLPKNRVCHKFKYCGGCSGFFKKKTFQSSSLLHELLQLLCVQVSVNVLHYM